MQSYYNYLDSAKFIGTKKDTIDMAVCCGSDTWEVIKVSPRKFALFCDQSVNLIPAYNKIVISSLS